MMGELEALSEYEPQMRAPREFRRPFEHLQGGGEGKSRLGGQGRASYAGTGEQLFRVKSLFNQEWTEFNENA